MDVEVVLGLSCVFPFLEALHNHIKFNQILDVFLRVSLLLSKYAKQMSKLCIITQPQFQFFGGDQRQRMMK
jgi:hypothetical protein